MDEVSHLSVKIMWLSNANFVNENFERKKAPSKWQRKVQNAFFALMLLVILFFPVKSSIEVNLVCTHGEELSPEKRTILRAWWYEPFAKKNFSETVLCEKHQKCEDAAYKRGVENYRRGNYVVASLELSKVTNKNLNFKRAQELLRDAASKAKWEEVDFSTQISVDIGHYLPDFFEGYKGDCANSGMIYGGLYVERVYAPSRDPQGKNIYVAIYRFKDEKEAKVFLERKIIPSYPENPLKDIIKGISIYLGTCEPYCCAVFRMGEYVYYLSSTFKSNPSKTRKVLQQLSLHLINTHEKTI